MASITVNYFYQTEDKKESENNALYQMVRAICHMQSNEIVIYRFDDTIENKKGE